MSPVFAVIAVPQFGQLHGVGFFTDVTLKSLVLAFSKVLAIPVSSIISYPVRLSVLISWRTIRITLSLQISFVMPIL